jgi:hypothetical protein
MSDATLSKTLKKSKIHLDLKLRGGGADFVHAEREIDICAGGLIKQNLVQDPGTHTWGDTPLRVFNIRVVAFHEFRNLTGSEAPYRPDPPIVIHHPQALPGPEHNAATELESLAVIHDAHLEQKQPEQQNVSQTANSDP